jgi:hypothetical protein
MTPAEANALAAIVKAVDGAGGRIRGTEVNHERKSDVASAMRQMLGGEAEVHPVFTLEIVADPRDVLDDVDDQEAIGEVTLDPEVAEVCLRELQILVNVTEHLSDEYGDAMTPLARARKRIEDLDGEGIDDFTIANVLQTLDGVASRTGAENSPIDPLQDDIFRAIHELEAELGLDEEQETGESEDVEISLDDTAADAGGVGR